MVADGRTVRPAAACTECQRRKQKCSREWPCNHCQARRIAHLCKFAPKKVVRATNAKETVNTQRTMEIPEEPKVGMEQTHSTNDSIPSVASDEEFRVLGYLPEYQNLSIGSDKFEGSVAISNKAQESLSPEMETVLRLIPPKPYADTLVQSFLSNANYHYYCLYPPAFSQDYAIWWAGKVGARTLTPEFTCLLLRVCACSLIFLDAKTRHRFEIELGESTQTLSERYHHAAQRLSSTIPPGKGGLTQVQQVFLTAFWFKTEARFIESWHSLSSAIHEAQELGMHKDCSKSRISEFDQEMRRRVWCLLYAWDWQMALLLSRPCIIHSAYCSFEVPNMRLESPETQPDLPSPITHVVFQSQLGQAMSQIPGVMGGSLSPVHANAVQQVIDQWFASFPVAYRTTNPDIQWDGDYSYVVLQRRQLHTIGYMTRLQPLKPCLTRSVETDMPDDERALRSTAVDCALKLMEISRQLLDCVIPANAKFHYATWVIFDTAAFLCSAIIHDKNQNLPRRGDVIETIGLALSLMETLCPLTKTGALCYPVLARLIANLSLPSTERIPQYSNSPESSKAGPKTPSDPREDLGKYLMDGTVIPNGTSFPDMLDTGVPGPIPLDFSSTGMAAPPTSGLEDLSSMDMDLGELSRIWDWETLDLDLSLIPPAF